MRKVFLPLIVALFLYGKVISQTKTSVAVFPFACSQAENKGRASQLQQMVMELLRQKSNVELIDRSNDSLLIKELNIQIRETSIAANGLVQQGKMLGARQMIVGTLSNISVESERKSNYNVLTGKNTMEMQYTANVTFALQLSDVETGKVINQKVFNTKDANLGKLLSFANIGTGNSKEEALSNAIKASRKQILAWINESYPPEIKILKIDERDKKGNPETVLVTGIDASLSKGSEIIVNEVEMINGGDGKSYRMVKKIAALKVKEIQGEITVCKVTDGEKVLEGKMTAGTKMEFTVK